MPIAPLAEVLGTTPANVAVRLSRARAELTRLLHAGRGDEHERSSEDDWNAMIDAWRRSPVGAAIVDPHGIRHRVMAESRRMTITLLLEYAVGLALVGFAAWRLATGPGLDDFVWGFALLWFTAMALQYASEARRNL